MPSFDIRCAVKSLKVANESKNWIFKCMGRIHIPWQSLYTGYYCTLWYLCSSLILYMYVCRLCILHNYNDNNSAKQIIRSGAELLHCGTMLLIITIVWQNGRSPLMYASRYGHVQVVAELLQHGAKVDMQDKVWSFHLSHDFVACVGLLTCSDMLCYDHNNNLPNTHSTTHTRVLHMYTQYASGTWHML